MYQLIYTSAPRLLEAGKTGFGTVARSKELPRPLVSYLERLSVFDRSAGIPALQFYSAFRMGALRYRVFSQVTDCGVDYTRRTNHVAHHFIIPMGSTEDESLPGTTPAGAMLALHPLFRRSWAEAPAWLPELPLPSSLRPETGGIWQRLTGKAANAGWLAASRFSSSCCLCVDAPMEIPQLLALLHEGQSAQQDLGWGRAFSTAIVDNLSVSAFPLVCLEGRQQQAGVRPRASVPCLNVGPGLAPPAETDFPSSPAPMADVEEIAPAPHFAPRPSPQPWQVPQEEQRPPLRPFEPAPAAPQQPAADKAPEESRNTNSYYIVGGIVALLVLFLYTQRDSDPQEEKPSRPTPVAKPQAGEHKKPGSAEQNKGDRGDKPVREKGKTPPVTPRTEKAQETAPVAPVAPAAPAVPAVPAAPVAPAVSVPSEPPASSAQPAPKPGPERSPKPSPVTAPRSEPKPASSEAAQPDVSFPEKTPENSGVEQPVVPEPVPDHYETHPDVIEIKESEKTFIIELRWEVDVSDIRDVMQLTENAAIYDQEDQSQEIQIKKVVPRTLTQPWSKELKKKARAFENLRKKYPQTKEEKKNLETAKTDFDRQLESEKEELEELLGKSILRATLTGCGGDVYILNIKTEIAK